eukprot:9570211-Alexandrium_andersonii.AAC.1
MGTRAAQAAARSGRDSCRKRGGGRAGGLADRDGCQALEATRRLAAGLHAGGSPRCAGRGRLGCGDRRM